MTAIVFIITLAILIFVHELGHFLVARRNKIKVEEFGFGFPPRIFGIQILDGEKSKTKKRFIWGKRDTEAELEHEEGVKEGTIYSVNWIPLGGFVKIKGEDGEHKNEEDSFSGKPAWVRIKVLGAGIIMNFVLAWIAISLALMIGSPQAIEDGQGGKDSKIQIAQVLPESPAEKIGIKIGDQVLKCDGKEEECQGNFSNVSQVQNYINKNKGNEISFSIKRGDEMLNIKGTPRNEYPQDQGALGISLVQTAIVSYPWYESIYRGLVSVLNLIWVMLETLFNIIKNLIVGQKIGLDVSGPVGIAYLTKQVTQLGFTYILQFVALLSINLGIINGFPFPALDGGRILFILIEKIKGSPVSQKIEQFVHTFGFIALIILMVLVTLRDVIKFEIFDKLKNLFG